MKQKQTYLFNSILIIVLISTATLLVEVLLPHAHWATRLLAVACGVALYRGITYFVVRKQLRSLYDSFENYNKDLKGRPLKLEFNEVLGSKLHTFEQQLMSLFDQHQVLYHSQQSLMQELERMNEVRDAMFDISTSMLQTDLGDKLYDDMLKNAVKAVENATHGSLAILGDHKTMEFLSVYGYDAAVKAMQIDLKHTFLYIQEKGEIRNAVKIDDILAFNKQHFSPAEYAQFIRTHPISVHSAISAPIMVDGNFYGMINVDSESKNAFDDRDVAIMDYFAKQVSILLKNKLLMERTTFLARFDTLTGIYHRGYFEEVFDNHLKKAVRYDELLSLVKIDIRNLRQVNTNLGQAAGDFLIKSVAKFFKSQIRDSDLLARHSGDQFVIAFFGSKKDRATEKISMLKEKLQTNPIVYKDIAMVPDFVYGCVECPLEGKTYDDLMRLLDERITLAKSNQKS